MQPHPLTFVALVGLLSVCVVTDLKSRRIANNVTVPGMVLGGALNTWTGGMDGLLFALSGCALALMILVPPFALGGVGGGDVKMMGAVGALIGPKLIALSLLFGMLAGGIVALVVAARRGQLARTLRATWDMLYGALAFRSLRPLFAPTTAHGKILLPYSVPLAFGTVAAVGYSIT